jgi:hypothetical protein
MGLVKSHGLVMHFLIDLVGTGGLHFGLEFGNITGRIVGKA